jgi:putative phosphoribosyl transferase
VSFSDRVEAGRRLAALLEARPQTGDVVVLGLPRGGVPVAAEVAAVLRAPLDVLVVRKLGVPFEPELAFGAIGEGGVRVVNEAMVRGERLSTEDVARVEAQERDELERRSRRYRGERAALPIEGRTAVIVDDGVATGATARAACLVARARGAARVVLAVPVAPRGWVSRLGDVADELVCVDEPREMYAVGQFYQDFSETHDEEVRACLRVAQAGAEAAAAVGAAESADRADGPADPEVVLNLRGMDSAGQLVTPPKPVGLVLFAHGSGSSRHSPRNRQVAAALNHAGIATLLFDLLSEDEERDRSNVFDAALLADRLRAATEWAHDWLGDELPIGYFGASTGAAAALRAAADPENPVRAVVSRGGRPDMAAPYLPEVLAPTLLIVGGNDETVLGLNRGAQAMMPNCECRLEVVPGATHLFEEPGALDRVSELAAHWFTTYLRSARPAAPTRTATPSEVSPVFHVILRGGPQLVDDENVRLVDEADPSADIERTTVRGTTARFRISGEYAIVNGHERRVYTFEEDSAPR